MILYHGTNVDFEEIDLSKSMPYKDFGRGFYLTDILPQAQRMAARKSHRFGTAIVQAYEVEDAVIKGLAGCRIKIFKKPNEEWAMFILNNRKRSIPPFEHDYDIICGLVADDGIAYILTRFEEGTLPLADALRELKYAHLSSQYCFCTPLSIKYLKRIAL